MIASGESEPDSTFGPLTDPDLANGDGLELLPTVESAAHASINAVAVADLAGDLISVNPAFLQMWGYEDEGQVLGRPVVAFWQDEAGAARVVRALWEDGGWAGEIVARRKDGMPFQAQVSASLVRDAVGRPVSMVGSFLDVTKRRRIDAELTKLYRAVEQSPGPVTITDIKGNIEYVNPKFTDLTGYQAEEVLGKNPRLLKSGQHPDSFYRDLWQTIRAGREWHGDFVNRRKDGELYWESASISPVRDASGKITHYVKVAEDVTARRQAEAALHQLTAELQVRNKDLDAYAHSVAHDLKGPLSIILGYADLLALDLAELPSDQLADYLAAIRRNAHKMNEIIEALLLLARVRSTEIEPEPLEMGVVVGQVLERMAPLIGDPLAEVTRPDSWPNALGYAPWIEEVWVNYLTNALKYGGSPPRVELGATVSDAGWVRFWVRDNGPGLSAEQQARLFAEFERLGIRRGGGHGLGLSIARSIVEKLGGEVGVESQPGEGSVFYFTLPAAAP